MWNVHTTLSRLPRLSLLLYCLLELQLGAAGNERRPDSADPRAAGLLMVSDKYEQILRTSNKNVHDPELTDYLRGLTCQTVGAHCTDLRIYVLREPGFNAFMLANGAMFVQTGFLLRAGDPSELAAMLGHETSHFVRGHLLESMRRWSRTASGFAVVSAVVVAAGSVARSSATTPQGLSRANNAANAGMALVGAAEIIAIMQLLKFDRDQEREADLDGIEWMHKAGLDVGGAPRLWHGVVEEYSATGRGAGLGLLSTHPASETRLSYLSEVARSMEEAPPPTAELFPTDKLRVLLGRYRSEWIVDELRVHPPLQFAAIVRRQIELGLTPGLGRYLARPIHEGRL